MSPKILRFAVILGGCGNKDGAEIHESVLTLLSIDRHGHRYQCFAPDVPQARVLNFLTNEPMNEKRNVLLEAARIARSKIKPLSDFAQKDFDILVLPGGSGVAYNLCTFAVDGDKMTVLPQVESALRAMHAAAKPIGAWCIAPVIIAHVLKKVTVTFGRDEKTAAVFRKSGATTVNTDARGLAVDHDNKVVTTPCYMLDARISEVAEGIDKGIQQLIKMV
ncbi:MAG: isoprenoid biosynthesis glyoxalase ElbB [Candidatus Omnitrophica bacterium]|nr:isoprenoid biosynthesis glyoxalase ElbB [Candidatus Omnitrophota bacterium]MDE2009337.1 isoprenoid biosynthesis glyoxalase ElbB [Candidatus Omnitrophota bacterium]MDE2214121.1 isoprenoid biosynthesis glyoxalase ElbB [Candidatus Omnitrophota bacterium]MDE2231158.1 isoprenoid biosynthesis glyoxalase ElbB [Candidatus Omnitrophota bacterium]